MGVNTRELRSRIKSVNSALHLTKAMGLVASSKMRGVGEKMKNCMEYERNLKMAVSVLLLSGECTKSPLLSDSDGRERLIVIGGDRGLSGGYNSKVFALAKQYPSAEFIPIGNRACERFGGEMISCERFKAEDAYRLSKKLCDDFRKNKFSRLGIIGTRYVSMLKQEPFVKEILPLKAETAKSDITVFEPNADSLLNSLAEEYVCGAILSSVCESFACEIASRTIAMDNSQKNAEQMAQELLLEYNRVRQGAITGEITEIVAGIDL